MKIYYHKKRRNIAIGNKNSLTAEVKQKTKLKLIVDERLG